jgi:hypothetical protein
MSVDWGRKEQQTLEEALSKFPAEKHSALDRFIRVASLLPDKGVRDVALRVRWMSRKEQGKRRKTEVDGGVGKKTGGRREGRAEKQSIFAMRPPAMPASGSQQQQQQQQQQAQMGSFATRNLGGEGIDGPTGQLLGENMHVINQVRHNLSQCRVQENLELFKQVRDNVLKIYGTMQRTSGIMSHMPPLPVQLNEQLANVVLGALANGISSQGAANGAGNGAHAAPGGMQAMDGANGVPGAGTTRGVGLGGSNGLQSAAGGVQPAAGAVRAVASGMQLGGTSMAPPANSNGVSAAGRLPPTMAAPPSMPAVDDGNGGIVKQEHIFEPLQMAVMGDP